MAVENIVKDYYRICTDAQNLAFDRVAFWTLDSQVQNESTGKSLHETLGDIKGITTSKSVTTSGYCVDATVIADMFNVRQFTIKKGDWVATGRSDFIRKAVVNTTAYAAGTDPDWCIHTASIFPTEAEVVLNNIIQIANFTGNTIEFYASDVPTSDATIDVKGL